MGGDIPQPRVLLISRGSSGDLYPFLGVATALLRRGVRVGFVANPYFERLVGACGAEFFPMGRALRPEDRLRIYPIASTRALGTLFWLRVLSGSAAGDVVPALGPAIETFRPDLILAHQNCLGAPWVAAKAGVESWTSVLAPCTVPSVMQPSVYSIGFDTTRLPIWFRRIQNMCVRAVTNAMVDPPVQKVRRSLGLPRRSDTWFGEMLSGTTVAMFSPAFRPPAPDDPAGLSIVGFPWFDPVAAESSVDASVESYLGAGDPPVIVAMGSMFSNVHARTNDNVVRACLHLNRRVLVVGAISPELRADARVAVVPSATYTTLFPRGACVVHHGGIGTTARVLRAGVPAVILPFAVDQFDNAARCRRFGIAAVSSPRASPRRLARTLRAVLDDPEVRSRAKALAPTFQGEPDGTEVAADRIVSHLTARRRRVESGAHTPGSSNPRTTPAPAPA